VRAAKLSPKSFLETAANSILLAPNSTLSALISYLPQVLYYASPPSELEKRRRDNALLAVEENLWQRFQRSKAKSDSQTASLSAFLQVASSSQAQRRLRNLLSGGKNDALSNEQRWAVVIRLSALGTPQGDNLIQEELKRSSQNSEKDLARTHALAARASQPSLAEKRTLMNRLNVSRDDSSYWDRWTIIENLFPRNQDQLRENLAADFFSGLTPFVEKNDLNLATLYASSLVPATCNEHSLIRLKNYVSSSRGQLPAPIMKALLVNEQEDEICVNVRKRMRGAGA
jgi:aminopeptidase N